MTCALCAGWCSSLRQLAWRTAFATPSAIYVAPAAAHGFRFSREANGLVLTVLADRLPAIASADPAFAAYLAETQVTPLAEDRGGHVAALAARIHEELHGSSPGRDMLLDAMVTEAVLRLARLGADARRRADRSPVPSDRDRQRINALSALIAAHCREHRPIGFYAEKLGLSAAHLNRIARRETGASVQELATRHLLRVARRDLVFSPTPVQGIAYALGFQDPAYFNRFFKRETGLTPGAFRQAEREKLAR